MTGLRRLVGNTPLLAIQYRWRGHARTVYAKAEQLNLTGSIKDRMGRRRAARVSAVSVLERGQSDRARNDDGKRAEYVAPDVELTGFSVIQHACSTCCDMAATRSSAGTYNRRVTPSPRLAKACSKRIEHAI